MNRCALIIPIYPPHYHYAKSILNDSKNSDVDIHFVFTNEQERIQFKHKTGYFPVVIGDEAEELLRRGYLVTYKRFYGLSRVFASYEYVATVDAEIKILRKNGWYDAMRSISESKTFYGARMPNDAARKIITESATKLCDFPGIKDKLFDFELYSWFSDIPVFDCSVVDTYLDYIGLRSTDKFIEKLTWCVFDHLVYQYYMVTFKSYTFTLFPHNWSFERLTPSEYRNFGEPPHSLDEYSRPHDRTLFY